MTDNPRSHLSSIQDICTGGPEFALGEMYGLRQWSTDGYDPYVLTGHYAGRWTVGQTFKSTCTLTGIITVDRQFAVVDGTDPRKFNHAARRYAAQLVDELREAGSGFLGDLSTAQLRVGVKVHYPGGHHDTSWRQATWLLDDPFSDFFALELPDNVLDGRFDLVEGRLELTARKGEHVPGHPLCTCGVYAYHDIDALPTGGAVNSDGGVYGLTRLYGHITVGTKGVRAEKADIIALTAPRTDLVRARRGSITDLRDKIVAGELAKTVPALWAERGITVVADVAELIEFGRRGGYLKTPPPAYPEGTPDPPQGPGYLPNW